MIAGIGGLTNVNLFVARGINSESQGGFSFR